MRHVMIDIETLGRSPGCPVVAIGAVLFDPDTGALGAEFEETVTLTDAMAGFVVDPETVAFWLGQSADARAALLRGTSSLTSALEGLRRFILGHDVYVWGNGATFDISILEAAYRQRGIPIPWAFWNIRDVRTIAALAWPHVKKDHTEFVGVPHRALDDAKHQARYVSAMWQHLRNADKELGDNHE